MSMHTDRSFTKAASKGAAAATDRETWGELMKMSKRELAEVSMHLSAVATGSYDAAIAGGDDETVSALDRLIEEREALKSAGII